MTHWTDPIVASLDDLKDATVDAAEKYAADLMADPDLSIADVERKLQAYVDEQLAPHVEQTLANVRTMLEPYTATKH